MMRTALMLVGSLVTGFVIASWWATQDWSPERSTLDDGDANGRPRVGQQTIEDYPASKLARLEAALRDGAQQHNALERKVRELGGMLAELQVAEEQRQRDSAKRDLDTRPWQEEQARARLREMVDEGRTIDDGGANRRVERLISAGFSTERAHWLARRSSEIQMQALQGQYDARRNGVPNDSEGFDGEQALRTELGEADYERYLTAIGRPTSVRVLEVLAGSPAEQAGLQRGDQIIAYGGERVFDTSDLHWLTLEGRPGEAVLVDLVRDGQRIQVVLPRGPVGIAGDGPIGGGF